MIECELVTPGGIAHSDAPAEAAKYKDGYSGDYCALVAPVFAGEVTFVSELALHGVCAWTTDDLIRVLQSAVSPNDLRRAFTAPGITADTVDDLLWNRVHGPAKRLRVVTSLILDEMLAQQHVAGKFHDNPDAALFTTDVAIASVDARLADAGSSSACTRAEVQSAFEWLTNPLVARAPWTDSSKTAIVRV